MGGGGLGAPLLVGFLVGFAASWVMRFRPGPFGNIGLGLVSVLAARWLLSQVSPDPGLVETALGGFGLACGLIWVLRQYRRRR